MEIADRGLLYPALGLAAASIFTMLNQMVTGSLPDLISIANLYLIGLGVGLVAARLGKLGPFQGLLGSPWHETQIQEILNREASRSARYDRDLTIVAIRSAGKRRIDFQRGIRATDQHIACRNGWNVIVLPETDRASALFLLRQVCGDLPVLLALAVPDTSRSRQRICADLLEQIRSSGRPEVITFRRRPARNPQPLPS